jgi:hypothetical protein
MLRILVDADAVPVKQEIFRVALRYGIKVIMVANSPVNIPEEDWLESVIVSGRFDAADDWIVENTQKNDIVGRAVFEKGLASIRLPGPYFHGKFHRQFIGNPRFDGPSARYWGKYRRSESFRETRPFPLSPALDTIIQSIRNGK